VAAVSWEQFFLDPIELPDGRVLRSLRDAGEFIQSLPKAMHERPEWQQAVEALLLVVEHDGDTLPARIGVMRALGIGKPAKPQPPRRRAKKHRTIP
jgi:hypothetical protein